MVERRRDMEKDYKNLDMKEVLLQMLQHYTDNCELTYTHGDLEFTIDITITKIVKNGIVEYDAEEGEKDNEIMA